MHVQFVKVPLSMTFFQKRIFFSAERNEATSRSAAKLCRQKSGTRSENNLPPTKYLGQGPIEGSRRKRVVAAQDDARRPKFGRSGVNFIKLFLFVSDDLGLMLQNPPYDSLFLEWLSLVCKYNC
jgi:hypothetical protein